MGDASADDNVKEEQDDGNYSSFSYLNVGNDSHGEDEDNRHHVEELAFTNPVARGRINPDWILLDNQSTAHLFSKTHLLHGIRKVTGSMMVDFTMGKNFT